MKQRRKVVQGHIDAIKEILDKLIKGEMGTTEAGEYVNKRAEELGIEKISKYTVQNLIEEILKSKPEEFTLYIKNRKSILRRKNGEKITQELRKEIIENELPRIMISEIEINKVARKYGKSPKAIINVIEKHLKPNKEEYEKYKKTVRKNMGGATIEQSRKSREKKKKISEKQTVINKEFVNLPLEEQREMVTIKYLQHKLKEKNLKGINDESTVEKKVKEKVKYFLGRNIDTEIEGNLTEEDILYMLYRFPNIVGFSIEDKIDKIMNFFEKEANLGFINTNHIVRTFPTVIGYSINRIKDQIKILQENNRCDAIIEHPMTLMYSPELLHALIEFAKERYKTDDLENVKNSNIFLSNRDIKKRCHTDYNEIKNRFPLNKEKYISPEQLNEQAGDDKDDRDKVLKEINRQKEELENNNLEKQ